MKQSKEYEHNYGFDNMGFGIAIYKDGLKEPVLTKRTAKLHKLEGLYNILPQEEAISFLGDSNLNIIINEDNFHDQIQLNEKLKNFQNTHPITYKNWSFAKEGFIFEFDKIKFELSNLINKFLLKEIINTDISATDSKYLFALILSNLESQENPDFDDIKQAITKTIREIHQISNKSQFNFIMSNGDISFAAKTDNPLSKNKLKLFYRKLSDSIMLATNPTFQDINWINNEEETNLYIAIRNENNKLKFKKMNLNIPEFKAAAKLVKKQEKAAKKKSKGKKSVFSELLNRQ